MFIKLHSLNFTKNTSRFHNRQIFVWLVLPVMMLISSCELTPSKRTTSDGAISEGSEIGGVLGALIKEGYEPNIGFHSKLLPGTIIQVMRRGKDGNPVKEQIPRVFLSADDCYKGIKTEASDKVLPGITGTKSGGFQVDGKALGAILPSLSFDNSSVENYSLKFNEPKVLYIPRGRMLGNMSMLCRKALTYAIKNGDHLEWYQLINEVVAAEGFSFTASWAGTRAYDIGYRKEVQKKLLSQLNDATSGSLKSSDTGDRSFELKTDKQIIFAYLALPIAIDK